MAVPTLSVEQQIQQLNDARKLVLSDANYYPQIIQGILPIIGPTARVELRRWGADFLAETFASPAVSAAQKENLALIVLDILKSMIEDPQEDNAVVKSVVQTAASIYPLVFRWMYVDPVLLTITCKLVKLSALYVFHIGVDMPLMDTFEAAWFCSLNGF